MKWRVSYADNLLNSFERRSVYTISLTGAQGRGGAFIKRALLKKF